MRIVRYACLTCSRHVETIRSKEPLSIDKSLVVKGKLVGKRSVLSKAERVKVLQEEGRWKEGESLFGLPKVRVVKVSKK